MVLDEDYFMNYTAVFELTSVENASELYRNYFLHVHKIYSRSPFKNIQMISSSGAQVLGVTLSPATAATYPGTWMKFTALVSVDGFIDQRVSWNLEGATDATTGIGLDGTVYVGKNETAAALTVTATSEVDPSIQGTATLTIAKAASA